MGEKNTILLKFRSMIVSYLAITLALFQIYTSFKMPLPIYVQRSFHLCIMLIIVFLTTPWRKNKDKNDIFVESKLSYYSNMLIAALLFVTLFYLMHNNLDIVLRAGKPIIWDTIFTWVIVILTLEGTRRTAGVPLMTISLVFYAYIYLGPFIPGYFYFPSYSTKVITTNMFNGLRGIFSTPIGVSATFIVMFIIFGSFLYYF